MEDTQIMDTDMTQDISSNVEDIEDSLAGWLDFKGVKHELREGITKVGRDDEVCKIVLSNEKTISKVHALFEVHNNSSVTLMDLGSRNKTRIRKMLLKPHVHYALMGEEEIQFGSVKATFTKHSLLSDAESEPMSDSVLENSPPMRKSKISELSNNSIDDIISPTPQVSSMKFESKCQIERNYKDFVPETPLASATARNGHNRPSYLNESGNNSPSVVLDSQATQSTPFSSRTHESFIKDFTVTPEGISPIKNNIGASTSKEMHKYPVEFPIDKITPESNVTANNEQSLCNTECSTTDLSPTAKDNCEEQVTSTSIAKDQNVSDDTQDVLDAFEGAASSEDGEDDTQDIIKAFEMETQLFNAEEDEDVFNVATQRPNRSPVQDISKKLNQRTDEVFDAATQVFSLKSFNDKKMNNIDDNDPDDIFGLPTQVFSEKEKKGIASDSDKPCGTLGENTQIFSERLTSYKSDSRTPSTIEDVDIFDIPTQVFLESDRHSHLTKNSSAENDSDLPAHAFSIEHKPMYSGKNEHCHVNDKVAIQGSKYKRSSTTQFNVSKRDTYSLDLSEGCSNKSLNSSNASDVCDLPTQVFEFASEDKGSPTKVNSDSSNDDRKRESHCGKSSPNSSFGHCEDGTQLFNNDETVTSVARPSGSVENDYQTVDKTFAFDGNEQNTLEDSVVDADCTQIFSFDQSHLKSEFGNASCSNVGEIKGHLHSNVEPEYASDDDTGSEVSDTLLREDYHQEDENGGNQHPKQDFFDHCITSESLITIEQPSVGVDIMGESITNLQKNMNKSESLNGSEIKYEDKELSCNDSEMLNLHLSEDSSMLTRSNKGTPNISLLESSKQDVSSEMVRNIVWSPASSEKYDSITKLVSSGVMEEAKLDLNATQVHDVKREGLENPVTTFSNDIPQVNKLTSVSNASTDLISKAQICYKNASSLHVSEKQGVLNSSRNNAINENYRDAEKLNETKENCTNAEKVNESRSSEENFDGFVQGKDVDLELKRGRLRRVTGILNNSSENKDICSKAVVEMITEKNVEYPDLIETLIVKGEPSPHENNNLRVEKSGNINSVREERNEISALGCRRLETSGKKFMKSKSPFSLKSAENSDKTVSNCQPNNQIEGAFVLPFRKTRTRKGMKIPSKSNEDFEILPHIHKLKKDENETKVESLAKLNDFPELENDITKDEELPKNEKIVSCSPVSVRPKRNTCLSRITGHINKLPPSDGCRKTRSGRLCKSVKKYSPVRSDNITSKQTNKRKFDSNGESSRFKHPKEDEELSESAVQLSVVKEDSEPSMEKKTQSKPSTSHRTFDKEAECSGSTLRSSVPRGKVPEKSVEMEDTSCVSTTVANPQSPILQSRYTTRRKNEQNLAIKTTYKKNEVVSEIPYERFEKKMSTSFGEKDEASVIKNNNDISARASRVSRRTRNTYSTISSTSEIQDEFKRGKINSSVKNKDDVKPSTSSNETSEILPKNLGKGRRSSRLAKFCATTTLPKITTGHKYSEQNTFTSINEESVTDTEMENEHIDVHDARVENAVSQSSTMSSNKLQINVNAPASVSDNKKPLRCSTRKRDSNNLNNLADGVSMSSANSKNEEDFKSQSETGTSRSRKLKRRAEIAKEENLSRTSARNSTKRKDIPDTNMSHSSSFCSASSINEEYQRNKRTKVVKGSSPVSTRSVRSSLRGSSPRMNSDCVLLSPLHRQMSATRKPRVLFTFYKDVKDEKIIKAHGGLVVETASECSVLVVDGIRRTCKFLACVARGVPIVSPQWVAASKSAGGFVDPWHYIVSDEKYEDKFGFSLIQSLKTASKQHLLRNFSVYVTDSVKPPPEQMREIIECAGGHYLESPPAAISSTETVIVISNEEDKSSWGLFKKRKLKIVSSEFILTGVLRQEIMIEQFTLK